jgi:hypothetical protein
LYVFNHFKPFSNMSLLDTASLIVTPNGYKEGKLYSVIPSDGSGDLSVTRATTATRVNSAGLVELVPYNLVGYSEQFDNAYWTKGNGTITANATTSPSGITDADKFAEDSSTDAHYFGNDTATATSGQSVTFTIFAKQSERSWIAIRLYSGFGSIFGYYNIANGTLGTIGAGGVGNIEDYGNGWYRCSLTITMVSNSVCLPYVFSSTGNGTITFTGTTGSGVFVWGAQLVEGSTALPYQKTETRLNIPRLDYSNGTCPSLLVEPQRTNLVTWSSSFDNAAWIKLNGSVTANATTSPDGTTNADSFIPNTTSGFHALRSNNFNQSSTTSHSWFLKANGYSKIAVRESDLPVGNYASFDLSTGTLISTSQSGIIENVGNGWYRCTLVDTNTGANAQTSIFVLPDSYTTGSPLISWSGDGIKGVYAYGAQAELGSYPTSYIPTTSASVTRNADVISKTGISSFFGTNQGTFFCDFVAPSIDALEAQYIFDVTDGVNVATNRLAFYKLSTGDYKLYTNAETSVTINLNTRNKVAIVWNGTNVKVYANGTQQASITYANTNPTKINLGSRFNDIEFGDVYFNAAASWPTALSNAELVTLTTL